MYFIFPISFRNCLSITFRRYLGVNTTIERIFADAKEKHGMRWTKYQGLEKVATHTMLTFAAMN